MSAGEKTYSYAEVAVAIKEVAQNITRAYAIRREALAARHARELMFCAASSLALGFVLGILIMGAL